MVRATQVAAIVPAVVDRPDSGHGAERPLHGSRLLTGKSLQEFIRARAAALGFDALGFASAAVPPERLGQLGRWIEAGHHGDMDWMERTPGRRADPKQLWPDVRSIVLVGLNYGTRTDVLAGLSEPSSGLISLYAQRRDYHDSLKGRLKELAGALVARAGGDAKVFVDTAPVMEKALAEDAGLGWQGKSSVLISRDYGTWLFLGALYTTLDLVADARGENRCGTCTACLDICPTQAFTAPYVLDSRRCIAYLTIEHKGHIEARFRAAIGNRIFGCDDCLAVCPWNKFAQEARDAKLAAIDALDRPSLAMLAGLDDAAFRSRFAGTPVKRTGRDRFIRNVLIAIGNSGDIALVPAAERLIDDASPLVRAMAIWALTRLAPDRARALAISRHSREQDAGVVAEWTLAMEQPL